MKNREKYAEEIMNYNGGNFCNDFVIPTILKGYKCLSSCEQCRMLQLLWLDKEYEEPEVDWSKVEVDTPILVRCSENEKWNKRHFARYENGNIYAWNGGCTSWTAYNNNYVADWTYAKLAEQEESDEQIDR